MVYTFYYKKWAVLWLSLFCLVLGIGTLYLMYEEMFYHQEMVITSGKYVSIEERYTPFSLSLLYRLSLSSVIVFLGCFFGLVFFVPKLLRRGPQFIITSEGVIDYDYGLLSWSQVASLKKTKIFVQGAYKDYIVIRIKDPIAYFGRYQSLFGLRRYLSIDVSLMHGNQEFHEYIDSKKA